MAENREHPPSENVLLTVLWFGTIWGALEAVVGGVLHLALPPTVPGRVMIVIAVMLMAYAVDRTDRLWMPAAMGLVAAPLKLLTAAMLSLPVTAPAVLNPAFAILAEGLAFTVIAFAFVRLPIGRPVRLAVVGLLAGGLQILVYALVVRSIGLAVYPPQDVLTALGTKYPTWAASAHGTRLYLEGMLAYAVAAGTIGGLAAGLRPKPLARPYRPAFLLRGIAASLVLCIAGTALLG